MMCADLFSEQTEAKVHIAKGATWLRGFALPQADAIAKMLKQHIKAYPPQQMMTPMGYPMSVRTTSFGPLGWIGTAEGYAYSAVDSVTQRAWPPLPAGLLDLAKSAAKEAGYARFTPDTCLINLYEASSKMGLHQDKDEQDFSQPIVSVSLGLPAIFLFGGKRRTDKTTRIPITHGDVLVWGGPSRLHYHGIDSVSAGRHAVLGERRFNLTFRKAGKI